jgi:hypothetical protein
MKFSAAAGVLAVSSMLGLVVPAWGVSCKTQAAMTDAERGPIVEAARQIGQDVQAGRTADLQAATIPEVAAHFDAIANAASALTPLVKSATITVDAVYRLDAGDAKAGEDQIQFFCDSTDNATHVTLSIQHLPPGQFALALVHATGVPKPQQMALLLQQPQANGRWLLAGFFPKPLTMAGHDGLWYWKQARVYNEKKQPWNAWLYYTTATYLLQPAGFFSSTNLERLVEEQQAARPKDAPGAEPLSVNADGAIYRVTSLRTDDALGGLDVVAHYASAGATDPVTARTQTIAVMRGLLALHPELRDAFHGMWVFADPAGGGQPFSLEQPMTALPKS